MAHGRHWPGDVQLEYCEFCGVRLPAAKRIQATTQEYAGRWACPECAPLVLNPSYLDYGGPGNLAPTPGETEPHSGVDWVTEIQGETVYSQFYIGTEDPAQVPDTTSGVSDPLIIGIPFTLPRRLAGNTVSTISLSILSVIAAPANIEAAIYQQTKALTNPGRFVADLGNITTTAGQPATFSPDLYLTGDAVYFFMYRSNGIAQSPGFSATLSNNILGTDIICFRAIRAGTPFDYGAAWPRNCGKVPWATATTPATLPAFRVTLET